MTVVGLEPCYCVQEVDGECGEYGTLLLHTGSGW